MAGIKDISQISDKWARVTPQRQADYAAGIQQPRVSWSNAAAASEERWKAGVTEAATQGRFGKGVKASGDQYWMSQALSKGPTRFVEGVAIGAPNYAEGFAPYASVISSTALPPRFQRGDPRNLDRVKAIATALRKRKTG